MLLPLGVRWQLWHPGYGVGPLPRLYDPRKAPVRSEEANSDCTHVGLAAGDVLYVPRGWPHEARAGRRLGREDWTPDQRVGPPPLEPMSGDWTILETAGKKEKENFVEADVSDHKRPRIEDDPIVAPRSVGSNEESSRREPSPKRHCGSILQQNTSSHQTASHNETLHSELSVHITFAAEVCPLD